MEKFIIPYGENEQVILGDSPPFIITNIRGHSGVDVDVQTQQAYGQDGESWLDSIVRSRFITIETTIIYKTEEEKLQLLDKLSRAFDVKKPITLQYENGEFKKEMVAEVRKSPYFDFDMSRDVMTQEKILIHLTATNPFWLDIKESVREMKAWIGGFSFPLSFPKRFAENGKNIVIENKGNVATPLVIEFYGPAENPEVKNVTTGEYIKVLKNLLKGEKLNITTAFGNKKVELVKEDGSVTNAFGYIDLNSTFFGLEVGNNTLEYSADSGEDEAKVEISFKNRFVGI